jgi:hypothetical protein
MKTIPQSLPPWQPEKHLQGEDRVWFLTNIERFESSYKPWSTPQTLFRAGIYDLKSGGIGLAHFGKDIGLALLKIGLLPPPWHGPQPFAVSIHRQSHGNKPEGRFRVEARRIEIDPSTLPMAQAARKKLARAFSCNAAAGMWHDLEEKARDELAIEVAVQSTVGSFSAGDIKRIVGKDVNVTPVLQRLVEDGVLAAPTGKKRGTRYELAPSVPLPERADWTG